MRTGPNRGAQVWQSVGRRRQEGASRVNGRWLSPSNGTRAGGGRGWVDPIMVKTIGNRGRVPLGSLQRE